MQNKIHSNVNIMDNIYDNAVVNAFIKQYQHLYVRAKSWEAYGSDELMIEMKNGDLYLYEWLYRRVVPIKLIEDPSELTEEEWKRGFSHFLEKEICNSSMTKYELAETVGISTAMLSRYLTGKAIPSGRIVQRIADALERNVNDILPHDYIPIR